MDSVQTNFFPFYPLPPPPRNPTPPSNVAPPLSPTLSPPHHPIFPSPPPHHQPILSPPPPRHPILSPPPPNQPILSPPPPHHPHYPPPPPHIVPPPPSPGHHHSTVIVVFVSLGGLFFLAFLSVALCCFIQKKKKKTIQKTDIIDIDEHVKVQETIVPGPHGEKTVMLTVEEDVHIHEEIKKSEKVSEGFAHFKSAQDHHHQVPSSGPGQHYLEH